MFPVEYKISAVTPKDLNQTKKKSLISDSPKSLNPHDRLHISINLFINEG